VSYYKTDFALFITFAQANGGTEEGGKRDITFEDVHHHLSRLE